MIYQLRFPAPWSCAGWLPPFNPEEEAYFRGEAFENWLLVDLWQAVSPDNNYVLDVGWIPERDVTGNFCCQLIGYQNWGQPEEVFETRNILDVLGWIQLMATFVDRQRSATTQLPTQEC